eukprot:CAMPEP_0169435804 /NCGR_PEP_ID=MMETSP1042-20121227/5256_1 /TAXON_ID=464988 /ORGANISM="Hemiselmis andersenii, Strain CCMP1180" /LENGTH=166 /DNA_ID=CAMNT_0009546467 /DNA_START=29 /DNA_END=526 /DNA_ORIENTATION=+
MTQHGTGGYASSRVGANNMGTGQMNHEEGRMWSVQGYTNDETVHAYPTSGMVDVIVRRCSGNKLQTIVASHGPCHYLLVQGCSKMVVLADTANKSVHLSDCNMVDVIIGGVCPDVVLERCRTVRLTTTSRSPNIRTVDCDQIYLQTSKSNRDPLTVTAEDVMDAPK